jgi:hypothetical protein
MVADIVTEMEYLRSREQRLRDTNESTNERVKWFAFGTMGMLVGLGAWQVVYLRAYFRYVELWLWWKMELVTDYSIVDLSTLSRFTGRVVASLMVLFWFCSGCIANPFALMSSGILLNSHDLNDIKCTPCFLQPGVNNMFLFLACDASGMGG